MSEQNYTMRLYYQERGGHTHLRIFTGKTGFTLGGAGQIILTNEEFAAWKEGRTQFEFLDEHKVGQT